MFIYGSAGPIKRVVQNVVYLSKTAWTFGSMCGKRAKIAASHRNYLVSAKGLFDFGR